MTKWEFLSELRMRLSGLPAKDAEEHLDYYCEMIDDRIEEGLSEEDAVAAVGTVSDVAAQILAEEPIEEEPIEGEVPKKRKARRKMRGWEITLLVLGSPIWLSLLIAAAAVLLAVYVVLWSVIVTVWAVEVSLIACALGGALGGIVLAAVGGNVSLGLLLAGGALVCAGLSVFGFFGCKAATKGMAVLTRALALGVKSCFVRKEKNA